MTRTTLERQYDRALVRVRRAFDKGKLPAAVGDLQMALESDCITVDEVDRIEGLIGTFEDLQVS